MIDRRHFIIATAAAAGLVTALPRSCAAAGGELKLCELHNKDQSFSDLALSLEGTRIDVTGFMTPPLKAYSNFFMMTKPPMAVCPFCLTAAAWPDEFLAV